MTLTTDTAGVLAQIIPVGLLVIAIEARALPKMVATGKGGTIGGWIIGLYFASGLILGFLAEYVLISNIVRQDEVSPSGTFLVSAGLVFLGITAFLVLALSLADSFGLVDRYGDRAVRKIQQNPDRAAKVAEYIRKHNRDIGEA